MDGQTNATDGLKASDGKSIPSAGTGVRSPELAASPPLDGRRKLSQVSSLTFSPTSSTLSLYPACPTPTPSTVDTIASYSVFGENGLRIYNRKREASIYSDINIAIFPPDVMTGEEALTSHFEDGESEVLPCSPRFQPLSASVLLLGATKFNSAASIKTGSARGGNAASDTLSGISDDRLSPTFITLPNAASIIHPVNGWLHRNPSANKSPRHNPALLSSGGAWLLHSLRSGAVAPATMPAVDTEIRRVSALFKSSASGEPDVARPMGMVDLTTSRADLVVDDEEEAGDCGWLCFRPKNLQKTRTAKWVLFWLCWAAVAQGMVVNGFVNVCITTIEKRFDLRSTDAGLIAGAYDLASVICSIPVSYLGSRIGSSKPRWLGWGAFIMGIGSFVFTLPHFGSPAYDTSGDSMSEMLRCLSEGKRVPRCEVVVENWLSSYRYIFVLGQFLHGVGACPLYTLGITYIDESVPVKMSSLYLGIFYSMAVIGPAFGYLLGGQFLKIYIDSPKIDPASRSLDVNSDLWLGAWWIGFLLSGALSIIISWPIMAFPAQLPGAKALKAERVSEAHSAPESAGGAMGFGKLRDLPQAVKVLTFNPTFVFLSFAGATEGILLAGFATFMPKFLENQFSMPASSAALIVGCIVVPAGGGGTFLGGWFIKKLQLRCAGIIKFCLVLSFMCVLACFTFVMSCPNTEFAGVSVSYQNRSITPSMPNLTASCNSRCNCQDLPYDPVCGNNNVMYFSACHAGCTSMVVEDGFKVYTGCECLNDLPNLNLPLTTTAFPSTEGGVEGGARMALDSARRMKCPSTCSLMPALLVIFFCVMLITFVISLPAVSATLRCVPDTHRSFGLGLQWIVVRLLGTIPGPILFGALIDDTCTLWQKSCGKQGACISHDNFYMSRYMMGISIIGKVLSTLFFFLSWWLYKPPPTEINGSQENTVTAAVPVKNSKEVKELRGIDNPAAELS